MKYGHVLAFQFAFPQSPVGSNREEFACTRVCGQQPGQHGPRVGRCPEMAHLTEPVASAGSADVTLLLSLAAVWLLPDAAAGDRRDRMSHVPIRDICDR